MFATIRRHQSWLFVIFAAVVILSFVAFGPNSCNQIKLENLKGSSGYGKIGDHTITQEELNRAEREVMLRYFLTTQHWPTDKSDFNVEREAYIRLFLSEKEKQFGIQVGVDS